MTIKTDDHTDLELALMVLLGYFGNGSTRKTKLGSRYGNVQKLVNKIGSGSMPVSDVYTRLNNLNKDMSAAIKNIITGE